jgi:hypothetical protein
MGGRGTANVPGTGGGRSGARYRAPRIHASMPDEAPWELRLLMLGAVLVSVAAAVLAAFVIVGSASARRRPSPQAQRWELISRLGYSPTEDSQWRKNTPGARRERKWTKRLDHGVVTLTELTSGGFRWMVRLELYNTVTLQLDERDGPTRAALEHPFATGVPEVDQRFVASADVPDEARPLLNDPEVVRCLLAVPFLWMHIHGDELVLQDRDGAGVKRLLPTIRKPDRSQVLHAEAEILMRVEALIIVFLRRVRPRSEVEDD